MKKGAFTISATANEDSKTYDIVKTFEDGEQTIYRTGELSNDEFEELEYNTEGDWREFLRKDGSYYALK